MPPTTNTLVYKKLKSSGISNRLIFLVFLPDVYASCFEIIYEYWIYL